MTVNSQRLLLAAAGAGGAAAAGLYVDDVFSINLWDGTGSAQTITNGIDLDGEGGMVWTKVRNVTDSHTLADSERGKTGTYFDEFASDSTYASQTTRDWGITSLNSNGFSLAGNNLQFNSSGKKYCSWTFRKAPGFFDIVTWSGNSTSGRQISHNLGSTPGCIMIKSLTSSNDWIVYHRSIGATKYLTLNEDYAQSTGTDFFNDTAPTADVFTVGNNNSVNGTGKTYVAYVFAHDDQSFGTGGDEAIIKCGSYTGGYPNSVDVDLGFEPQWLLVKRSSTTGNWALYDNMRGVATGGGTNYLDANESSAEATNSSGLIDFTANGFTARGGNSRSNYNNGDSFVYVAIRRSHKPPEAGTDVFKAIERSGTGASATVSTVGFPLDFLIVKRSDATGYQFVAMDRLRGIAKLLQTADSSQENTNTTAGVTEYTQDGFKLGADGTGSLSNTTNRSGGTYINWAFRRGAGFFDVVAYTGTGSARTVNHQLAVKPELIITKARNYSDGWGVQAGPLGATKRIRLDLVNAASTNSGYWNNTEPTSSVFTVGTDNATNGNTYNYIAYLFASLSGVSKIGTYTGTGSNIGVDCGFTAGARFIMIKRTDSSGNWYVWDHARGIVGGNDPYLEIDNNNAQVTSNDYIDPLNSGFTVTSSAPADLNASGGTYLFLAIA